jgi:anaerobic ribonucleoside-triphosphate reductase activating protein
LKVWVAGIDPAAVAETDGIAYTIYFSGCPIRCPGCHNQELWDKESGKEVDIDCIIKDVRGNLELINTVCILGGEPTYQLEALKELLLKLQDLPIKIWLYTGLQVGQLEELINLDLCDVIKCGCYDENTPPEPGSRLASGNQYFVYIDRKDDTTNAN